LDDLIVGAFRADVSGKSDAGKSYVIFGKKDSTAIDLSAIASGSGTPLTSPAVETVIFLKVTFSLLMTNPPVPLAIADRSIVVLSFLPKMTLVLIKPTQTVNQTQVNLMLSSVKPTAQQSTYLLLPVAQGDLLLTVNLPFGSA
jgi:hypothetical protein